eukprot:GEMP01019206.1.p1 GENE.GEMP01019206.1~~GEMP01019206.1.p1  ORF type:complete len:496 (+),score=100.38 GEMP01019206.1:211-1698(+)
MAPFSQIALFLLRASLLAPSVEVRADDIQFRPTDLFDQGVGEDEGVEVDSATLIITMKEGNGGENPSLDAYCKNTLLTTLTGCKTAVFLELLDICILTFRDRDSAQAARDTTNMSPFIAASELPARFTMAEEPNDPRFNEQWGATDVDLPAAWEIFSGDSQDKLIVAVVDTGVDYTHPDLKNHMWQGEAKGGYDFVADNPDPMDSHGHGTHCAGIIAAQGNNKLGVTGALLSGVQIMALKVSTKKGHFKDAAILKAMNYALRHKVRISSHSYSTTNNVDVFHRVADAAIKNNHLMIIAAGNDGKSLEEEKAYPCCLASSSIICVAAIDKNLSLRKYSNYGTTCVDIAAPGEDILSTKTGGGYETRSGTSFASPIVAGVAALALGFRSNLTASALKQAIQNGVKPDARLKEKVKWGGRVNVNLLAPIYAKPPLRDNTLSAWQIVMIIAAIVFVLLVCVAIVWRFKVSKKTKIAGLGNKAVSQPDLEIHRVASLPRE